MPKEKHHQAAHHDTPDDEIDMSQEDDSSTVDTDTPSPKDTSETSDSATEKDTDSDGNADEPAQTAVSENKSKVSVKQRLARIWPWAISHKKLSIPLAGVVLLALLLALPFSRYELLGLVWKQNFRIVVLDAETGKPVSSADVKLDGNATQSVI